MSVHPSCLRKTELLQHNNQWSLSLYFLYENCINQSQHNVCASVYIYTMCLMSNKFLHAWEYWDMSMTCGMKLACLTVVTMVTTIKINLLWYMYVCWIEVKEWWLTYFVLSKQTHFSVPTIHNLDCLAALHNYIGAHSKCELLATNYTKVFCCYTISHMYVLLICWMN